jgi:signal transduction histidine kinase/HD-GYP domain-containing protein (c-di-GMP phosphodiesterase class II)
MSWVVLEITPVLPPEIVNSAFGFAHLLDVAMLVIVLGGVTSNYVHIGRRFKTKASKATLEVDAAKAELTKLSNIATNIYEDSSDLIKKQKEQTLQYMKKAENLEKILQIGVNIQKRHELDDVLKMIVEMIRDNIGFKTVILRLFNKKAQNFEARAFVGLSDELRDSIVNYRIPTTEYQKMIDPRFRISRSYFVKRNNAWYGEDLSSDHSVLVEDSWREIDTLIIPLLNEDQMTIGYLSVESPENPKLSVPDVIDTLENVATLAVIAIRNARFVRELEAKNEKLSIYADKLSGLNKLKANFVQTVSHEFRTPLTSIKAYCETLLKNAETVERELLKQFLFVIDEESSRLMTLIEDILDFSQMESGTTNFERSPCALQKVVDEAASELSKNFENKQINLHCTVPERELLIHGNCEMVRQLVVNLLHNASKFTKEEGNVWLTVQEDPGSVRIVVEDDGIGIPDGQLARIFEQFYQVDNSSTRQHGGSGLGLAMCKSIVEWHDGRIWVENVSGRGARFVAVLPKKEVVVSTHVLDTGSTVRRFEIERFLEILVENVAEFVNVGKASIMLIDRDKKELRIECAIGMDEEIVANASVKLGEGIAGKVAEKGKTMLVSNIEEDDRVSTRSNNDLMYRSKSFLSVPIWNKGQVVGVVNVASPMNKPSLDEDDARLLEALVERFSVAIDKITGFADASARFEQVRDSFKAILDSKRFIDARYYDLVKSFALRTGDKLGMDESARVRLHYLLNVYDLGLSKIGYHIIKNPKDLSPKDREEIHKHTIIGQEMLAAIEEDQELANVILCHHENYDGSGYPGQLQGDAIPIEARIIRVADSLRALVSNRPYQRQYSLEEAKDVLKHRSGTFFDPMVVDAYVEAMDEVRDTMDTDSTKEQMETDNTVDEPSLASDRQGERQDAKG